MRLLLTLTMFYLLPTYAENDVTVLQQQEKTTVTVGGVWAFYRVYTPVTLSAPQERIDCDQKSGTIQMKGIEIYPNFYISVGKYAYVAKGVCYDPQHKKLFDFPKPRP